MICFVTLALALFLPVSATPPLCVCSLLVALLFAQSRRPCLPCVALYTAYLVILFYDGEEASWVRWSLASLASSIASKRQMDSRGNVLPGSWPAIRAVCNFLIQPRLHENAGHFL